MRWEAGDMTIGGQRCASGEAAGPIVVVQDRDGVGQFVVLSRLVLKLD